MNEESGEYKKLLARWRTMGAGYAPIVVVLSPEDLEPETILDDSLPAMLHEGHLFGMALASLDQIADLTDFARVESVVTRTSAPESLAAIYALAAKLGALDHRAWGAVAEAAFEKIQRLFPAGITKQMPRELLERFSALRSVAPADTDLARLGVDAPLFNMADRKKILPLRVVLRLNPYLSKRIKEVT